MNDLPYDLPAYGVNVRDYGARGDDSTDDAPAIQAALDAGRGLVTIPYGVYRIGRTLRVPAHTYLRVHPHARCWPMARAWISTASCSPTSTRSVAM